MIYLIIFNFLLIIWLYIKYIHIPRYDENNYTILDKLDSALIGYIDDENGNTVDWILAEILELSRKKYITIDYIKNGIDEYDYIIRKNKDRDIQDLEKYQLTAYRLLFDYCDEITMDELEERIKNDVIKTRDTNVKGFSIKKEIEEELIHEEILDYKGKKYLKFIRNLYIVIALIILFYLRKIEFNIAIIFSIQIFVILFMVNKARPFTILGKRIYVLIKNYKTTLEDNKLLKDKKIIHNILLEKEYSNAIALHLINEAKKEFINDELVKKEYKDVFISLAYCVGILVYILYFFVLPIVNGYN